MKDKSVGIHVHPVKKPKPSEAQRIESARLRSRGFREMLNGERTMTRGEAVQTEWGNRVRIIPGELKGTK